MRPQPEPEPSGEEGQPPVDEEQVTVEVADEDSPLLDAEPTHTRAAVSPAAGKVHPIIQSLSLPCLIAVGRLYQGAGLRYLSRRAWLTELLRVIYGAKLC